MGKVRTRVGFVLRAIARDTKDQKLRFPSLCSCEVQVSAEHVAVPGGLWCQHLFLHEDGHGTPAYLWEGVGISCFGFFLSFVKHLKILGLY